MDSVLVSSGRENCTPTILRIIIQSLVAFVPQAKNLKRNSKFAFEFMEISWGLSQFSYPGDLSGFFSPLDFSFVVNTGPSVPSTRRKFAVNQTPTFGQSQGATRPNPPGSGCLSSSDALFSAGSQPSSPTLGTVSSSCQPPVFGQQPGQSAFGPRIAPAYSEL